MIEVLVGCSIWALAWEPVEDFVEDLIKRGDAFSEEEILAFEGDFD